MCQFDYWEADTKDVLGKTHVKDDKGVVSKSRHNVWKRSKAGSSGDKWVSDTNTVLRNSPAGHRAVSKPQVCWAGMECLSIHTLLYHQLGTAQGRVVSVQWWIHPVKKQIDWQQQQGLSVNLLLEAVSPQWDLSGTSAQLSQYMGMVAYEKTHLCHQKKITSIKQMFFLVITSSCWATFWREKTSIRTWLTDKIRMPGGKASGFILSLFLCHLFQETRRNCAGLPTLIWLSCSLTTFTNSSLCPANVLFPKGRFQSPSLPSPSLFSGFSWHPHCLHAPTSKIFFLQLQP